MDEYKKTLKVVWDFSKGSLEKFMKDTNRNITQGLKSGLKSITDPIVGAIKGAFKDSIKEMKDMLEYSQLSSSRTRELAFGYGFSSSEAFGWEKALDLVGLESEEDLFYANQQELQQFRKAFEKYSSYYEDLYDSGFFEQMQEYQFEMADFKNEMQMEIVEFFMNNKELIKNGMKGIMKISEVLLRMFSWLVGAFGSSNDVLTASEIVKEYSNVTNKTNNVSVSNNFNGIGRGDETRLSDMGNLTYAQIIEALGGDA